MRTHPFETPNSVRGWCTAHVYGQFAPCPSPCSARCIKAAPQQRAAHTSASSRCHNSILRPSLLSCCPPPPPPPGACHPPRPWEIQIDPEGISLHRMRRPLHSNDWEQCVAQRHPSSRCSYPMLCSSSLPPSRPARAPPIEKASAFTGIWHVRSMERGGETALEAERGGTEQQHQPLPNVKAP